MKQSQKISGQIMVIVLLILSVVSIIALTITLATVRDTQEQVQNQQYQQYYSIGEKMLLDVQKTIGSTPLQAANTTLNVNSDATGTSLTSSPCVDGGTAQINCDFRGISSSEVNPGSSETFDVHVEIVDTTTITGQSLNKDQDLLIELDAAVASSNTTTLTWTGLVDWNISYDYVDGSNNYLTKKLVYHVSGGPYSDSAAGATDPCFSISGSGNTIVIQTTNGTCTPAVVKPLYFRLKPVGANVTFDLDKGGTVPLQRTIRTVTTSSRTAANGNEQNPTSVLETKYLLTKNPLSLFDYVLRTEQGVTKDQ